MALYVAQARGEDETALTRATFVREGFSFAAFVFGPFWLLYRRLWLAALVWILAETAYVFFLLPHQAPAAAVILDLMAHLFLGFEGRRLQIARDARRAVLTDLVEGRSREEAETQFYRRNVATAVAEPVEAVVIEPIRMEPRL